MGRCSVGVCRHAAISLLVTRSDTSRLGAGVSSVQAVLTSCTHLRDLGLSGARRRWAGKCKSAGQTWCADMVRRQGLEPRTRRLRVPGVQYRPVVARCVCAGHNRAAVRTVPPRARRLAGFVAKLLPALPAAIGSHEGEDPRCQRVRVVGTMRKQRNGPNPRASRDRKPCRG